jgi:hypothetical protein
LIRFGGGHQAVGQVDLVAHHVYSRRSAAPTLPGEHRAAVDADAAAAIRRVLHSSAANTARSGSYLVRLGRP